MKAYVEGPLGEVAVTYEQGGGVIDIVANVGTQRRDDYSHDDDGLERALVDIGLYPHHTDTVLLYEQRVREIKEATR